MQQLLVFALAVLWTAGIALGQGPLPSAGSPAKEEAPARTIAPETSPKADRAIARRLAEIFAEIKGAEGIRVDVRSGVVVLSGEVLTPALRERVVKLANQVDGVVEVRDETQLVRGFGRQLAPLGAQLSELVSDAVGYLPIMAVALAVFLLFWLVAMLLARWDALYRRFTANAFLCEFLRNGVKAIVLLVGVIAALEVLNATAFIGTALGAAGLIGLVLGFALRDTVENYFAGILLSVRQPFVPHDRVLISGFEGDVVRLTPRATILMTLDGNHVRIPNATVFNGVLVNYTRNPLRRFQFDIAVGTRESLAPARQLAATTLAGMAGVLADPAPHVDVHALGDSNVMLRVYGWMDQRGHDFLKVRSEAIRLVKEAFDAAAIEMPAPIISVQRAGEPAAPAPHAPIGPREAIDVVRRDEIAVQVANERRRTKEPDLLRPDAPRE